MATKVKNNIFVKLPPSKIKRLDVLCSVHGITRPILIESLLDRAWEAASNSGKLEEWLKSLAGDDELEAASGS